MGAGRGVGRQNSRKKSEVEGGRAAADEPSHPIAADRRKRGLAPRDQRLNGSDEGADAERRAVGAGWEEYERSACLQRKQHAHDVQDARDPRAGRSDC